MIHAYLPLYRGKDAMIFETLPRYRDKDATIFASLPWYRDNDAYFIFILLKNNGGQLLIRNVAVTVMQLMTAMGFAAMFNFE